MQQLIAVALGGALGAVCRFILSLGALRLLGGGFPFGTLLVNVLGSLLAGLCFVLIVERGILPAEWRDIVIIGFLGGLTTFSTFSLETWWLLQAGALIHAAFNVILNVTLCLLATWLGFMLARTLW